MTRSTRVKSVARALEQKMLTHARRASANRYTVDLLLNHRDTEAQRRQEWKMGSLSFLSSLCLCVSVPLCFNSSNRSRLWDCATRYVRGSPGSCPNPPAHSEPR